MCHLRAPLIVAFVLLPAVARAQVGFPPGFSALPVGSGWRRPVGIAFSGPGEMLVAERQGTLWFVEDGVQDNLPILNLMGETLNNGDRGLLDVAADPDFENNGYIYLLVVVDPDGDFSDVEQETFCRLLRYTVTHDVTGKHVIDPASRLVLIGQDFGSGIPSCHWSHAIGTVKFLADGSLVCSTGDGAHYDGYDPGGRDPDCFSPGRFSSDQDVGALRSVYEWTLAGKILRVDPATGLGLPDNPYYTGNPSDIRSRIWALGLRNPYRFTLHDVRGPREELYIGDVGWESWEEIDRAAGGENFGWPCFEGDGVPTGYANHDPRGLCADVHPVAPVLTWNHTTDYGVGFIGNCVSGLCFYTGTSYPAAYRNALFFCDYGRNWLKVAQLDQNGNIDSVLPFSSEMNGTVDIEADPVNGDLYLVSIASSRISHLVYTPGNQAPVPVLAADRTYGPVPLTVNLSAAGSYDPDGEPLTYSWDLGDGTSADTQDVVKTYGSSVNAEVVLTVKDGHDQGSATSVLISPGNSPPNVTLLSPADGDFYHAGDTISLAATATDVEDDASGTPLAALWTVNLIHDHHIHPGYYQLPGFTNSFVAESHGSGTYLEIVLTVTDSRDLVSTRTIHLYDADAVPKAHIVSLSHDGTPRLGLPLTATGHAEYAGKGTLDLTWDWGDGSPVDFFPGVVHQQDTTPTHLYAVPGEYTITLTAEDDGSFTTQTTLAKVGHVRPAIAIFYPLVEERWVSEPDQAALSQALSDWLDSLGFEVKVFTAVDQDRLADWMRDYLDDGVCDVMLMMDFAPAAVYAGEDEGSLAEEWVEHGNGIVWTGQEPFSEYLFANGMTDLAGAGDFGLDDLLDAAVPGISGGSGTMKPSEHARELPSYQEYFAWRALRYDQLGPFWHVDRCYGADGSHESDVIVVRHRSAGFYAQFYCTFRVDVPRTNVIREFIRSYVLHLTPSQDLRRRMKY
jgi:glucose/arabinose dehydrogenase